METTYSPVASFFRRFTMRARLPISTDSPPQAASFLSLLTPPFSSSLPRSPRQTATSGTTEATTLSPLGHLNNYKKQKNPPILNVGGFSIYFFIGKKENITKIRLLYPKSRKFCGRFFVLPTEAIVTYCELVGKREISPKFTDFKLAQRRWLLSLR